jgi:hypothetical protein
MKYTHSILVGMPEENRPLRTSKLRWWLAFKDVDRIDVAVMNAVLSLSFTFHKRHRTSWSSA